MYILCLCAAFRQTEQVLGCLMCTVQYLGQMIRRLAADSSYQTNTLKCWGEGQTLVTVVMTLVLYKTASPLFNSYNELLFLTISSVTRGNLCSYKLHQSLWQLIPPTCGGAITSCFVLDCGISCFLSGCSRSLYIIYISTHHEFMSVGWFVFRILPLVSLNVILLVSLCQGAGIFSSSFCLALFFLPHSDFCFCEILWNFAEFTSFGFVPWLIYILLCKSV